VNLVFYVLETDDARLRSRLDLWLAARLENVSRAKVQRMIANINVTVNGRAARNKDPLSVGDKIEVSPEIPPESPMTPVQMPLVILFEDDHIIVIDKPAGLSVHPGAGSTGPTLVQGLLYHVGPHGLGHPQSAYEDPLATLRPGIVHRLDKDTSGIMVCAKSDRAHAHLARQFHDKTTLRREYGALLDGMLKAPEVVRESWLARDPSTRVTFMSLPSEKPGARFAKSLFRVEEVFEQRLTLVGVRLFTGRTHQIRVHAKDLGAPVIGDLVYHRPTVLPQTFSSEARALVGGICRQLLHARHLTFMHPVTERQMSFDSPYPFDFTSVLNTIRI
jgi:23S rRNA pseudouridine1911/1915/1917 synthase